MDSCTLHMIRHSKTFRKCFLPEKLFPFVERHNAPPKNSFFLRQAFFCHLFLSRSTSILTRIFFLFAVPLVSFGARKYNNDVNKLHIAGARRRAERKLCVSTDDLIWIMPT